MVNTITVFTSYETETGMYLVVLGVWVVVQEAVEGFSCHSPW